MNAHPHPLDEARRMLRSHGSVVHTKHAMERMAERRVDPNSVHKVLFYGTLQPNRTRFNQDLNSWSYSAVGTDLDGKRLRVVFALIAPNVVTVTVVT